MRICLFAVLSALSSWGLVSTVAAQAAAEAELPVDAPPVDAPPPEYLEIVAAAIGEYGAGNFDEALALFERAYAMRPSARVLRGIGKVRFEQRQYVLALDALERALTTTLDPLTDEMRAEVEDLVTRARSYVGELTIVVTPADATVTLDGRELAAGTTFPLRLDIGAHLVSVAAEGYEPATRTADVASGAVTRVEIAMIERSPEVVVVSTSRDTTGAWVTGGIGVALVGATIGVGVWMGNRLDAAARCADGEARGLTCATESAIGTERDAAIGTLVTASVLTAAIGVTFAVLVGEATSEPAPITAACAPLDGGALCTVGGSF